MALFVKKCPCLRPKIEEDIRVLDYRHCSLNDVPSEVFNFERTLEELLMDSNQIQDLPRELFYCHGIRKLSISDNEIKQIPAAIEQLICLETLDLSKNGVINLPDNIKTCKYLQIVDASVNPLGKLPEGFTQLLNLTQLYLNDTLLDYLPGNFGRLSKLKILEIRENHLKTLPNSFSRLAELEKLDIGHNEFTELPDVIGSLSSLLELWCDQNQIQSLTPTIGNLKQLMFFDGCKNCLQSLPSEIEGCISLADLHLTTNQIQALPDSIGNLANLTTLKVDDNCLTALPATFGGLSSLSELNVSANCLRDLPASLGLLGYLRTLYADENQLEFIPAELGSCSGITVLSLRSNKLTYIPDEIGRIPRLRVLNLSANQLKYLPFTFVKLKELQALWLSENQTRPLIPLQSEHEPDNGRKILTCYLLPQRPPQETGDVGGDTDSFHASQWEDERLARQQIHFEFGNDSDVDGSLIRQPTPYPKEMREKARHLKNLTLKQQMNNNTSSSWSQGEDNAAYVESPSTEKLTAALIQDNGGFDGRTRDSRLIKQGSPSLHDPYTLYRYDKEKFAKDKARMQQKHNAIVNNNDEKQQIPRKTGSHENSPARSDCSSSKKGKDKRSRNSLDDGDCGFNEPRVSSHGSIADLPSSTNGRESSAHRKFTYCSPEEMSENLALRSDVRDLHISNHRSHRSYKMRDYDSDTGYRSDQEMMRLRHQQQQMYGRCSDNYSEIVPVHNLKSHRRDGYSSDLEGYSQRSSLGTALNNPSDLSNQNSQTHSVPYDINRTPPSSHQLSTQTSAVKNDELYDQTSCDINHNNCVLSSPTSLKRRNFIDLPTPVTPTQGRSNHSRPDKDYEYQLGVQVPLDPENRYMPTNPEQSQVTTTGMKDDTHTVPAYKPAPPHPFTAPQRKLPPTPNRSSPYGTSVFDRPTRGSPMKDYQQRMPDIQEVRDQKSDRSRSRDYDLQDLRNSDSESVRNYVKSGFSPRIPTLQCVNPTRTSQIHNQVHVEPASSKNSGNSNYNERTIGDSPVSYRHSPLSGRMERRHSRTSPFQYAQDPRHTFERYDSSFHEPATIDIPVRYEDIAIFKSSEPPSQVSSSTDSGYGHNIFEKMMESQRFTGSPKGSASPDHFNSDSNCTSSSHTEVSGQYSRGATPTNNSESHIPVQPEQGTRYERGLFMTKVPLESQAAAFLQCGNQLPEVNNADLTEMDHHRAVNVHRSTGNFMQLYVERDTTS